jgi:hypothetical protein
MYIPQCYEEGEPKLIESMPSNSFATIISSEENILSTALLSFVIKKVMVQQ